MNSLFQSTYGQKVKYHKRNFNFPEISIKINNNYAEIEKYNKKKCTLDLPCDITVWTQPGENLLSIYHNPGKRQDKVSFLISVKKRNISYLCSSLHQRLQKI